MSAANALPFRLPAFYMPYPARLNPYLAGARAHCKAWAYQIGILRPDGSGVWDEPKFDIMDFALFAAQTHPDAPAAELNTLTDWFIWGWFVDDYFPFAYGQGADLGAARKYLLRLLSFMPLSAQTAIPQPSNPAERGIADLWPRTAHRMSSSWQHRCVANIQAMAEASLWEVYNRSQNDQRVLDPIEFIAMRRQICGMAWAADLVEFSIGNELPEAIYRSRPIRVVNDVFADAGGLRNDILSYHHDVNSGTRNNGVMVMQAFLGCDLARAVEVLNDLISARMFQLENTVAVELPAYFAEQRIDQLTQWKVLRYVRAVQDWMGGEYKWCVRPGGRYLPAQAGQAAGQLQPDILELVNGLTGIGTASLRPALLRLPPASQRLRSHSHVLGKPVGPVALPDFYMPYPVQVNPHQEHARQSCATWCRAMGMLDPLPGAPGGVWSAESLAAFDPAYFAARLNDAMSADTLTLCTQWMTWATYADDYYFVKFGAARDLAAAKLQDRRLAALMRVDGSSPLAPESALEAGLGSLWQRTAPGLSVEHRAWLRETLVDMLASWSWEIVNQSQHRIPDLVEYVEMRRKTYGSDFTVLLCLLTAGAEIPAEVLASQPVRSLTAAAHDYGCFVNDICSYRKEIELDGEIHNGVLVLENWLDIDLDRAIALLNALMTARVGQFEHVRTVELPALMDDLGLPAEARTAVRSYVDRLQNWMAALWAFNKTTRRYEKGALAQALGPSAGRVGLGAPPLPQPAAPPRSPTAPPQPVEKSFLLGLGPSSTIASHAKRTDVVE